MENEIVAKKISILWFIIPITMISIGVVILLWPKPKDVSVEFDSKGGTPVETITVKEGTVIDLPETEKKGYDFAGWYLEDIKLPGKTYKVTKDVLLVAKWVLGSDVDPETPIKFEITFDSGGGSTLEPITVECGKELKLPEAPTKEGYTFLYWVNTFQHKVEEGELLACEKQTLTAVWEKKKEYTCPNGYQLSGRECVMKKEPTKKCKDNELDIGNNTYLGDFKDDDICGAKTVFYPNGSSEKAIGEEFYDDLGVHATCYYGRVTVDSEEICNSQYGTGHYKNNQCYLEVGEEVNECPTNHIYFTEEQLKRKTNLETVQEGCYVMNGLTSFCEEGYSLSGDSCIKKVAATEKK